MTTQDNEIEKCEHEIGRAAITHEGHTHPTGDQKCLKCDISLDDLFTAQREAGKKEGVMGMRFEIMYDFEKKEIRAQALKEVAMVLEKVKTRCYLDGNSISEDKWLQKGIEALQSLTDET